MLAVNVKEGKLYLNDEVKQAVVDKKPYIQLLKNSVTPIAKGSFKAGPRHMYVFVCKYVCLYLDCMCIDRNESTHFN